MTTQIEKRISSSEELTDKMKGFLVARRTSGTDAEAARVAKVVPQTVTNWKLTKPQFLEHYDDLMNYIDKSIVKPEDFVEQEWLETNVPKAWSKLAQILDIDITPVTQAQMIAQVRQAAEKVLTGTGRLAGADLGSLSVTQIIQNFYEAGNEYQPQFKVLD